MLVKTTVFHDHICTFSPEEGDVASQSLYSVGFVRDLRVSRTYAISSRNDEQKLWYYLTSQRPRNSLMGICENSMMS